ncbi:hypothetical protein VULLAG_LOCUS5162 [Vulpes lagopus]
MLRRRGRPWGELCCTHGSEARGSHGLWPCIGRDTTGPSPGRQRTDQGEVLVFSDGWTMSRGDEAINSLQRLVFGHRNRVQDPAPGAGPRAGCMSKLGIGSCLCHHRQGPWETWPEVQVCS